MAVVLHTVEPPLEVLLRVVPHMVVLLLVVLLTVEPLLEVLLRVVPHMVVQLLVVHPTEVLPREVLLMAVQLQPLLPLLPKVMELLLVVRLMEDKQLEDMPLNNVNKEDTDNNKSPDMEELQLEDLPMVVQLQPLLPLLPKVMEPLLVVRLTEDRREVLRDMGRPNREKLDMEVDNNRNPTVDHLVEDMVEPPNNENQDTEDNKENLDMVDNREKPDMEDSNKKLDMEDSNKRLDMEDSNKRLDTVVLVADMEDKPNNEKLDTDNNRNNPTLLPLPEVIPMEVPLLEVLPMVDQLVVPVMEELLLVDPAMVVQPLPVDHLMEVLLLLPLLLLMVVMLEDMETMLLSFL